MIPMFRPCCTHHSVKETTPNPPAFMPSACGPAAQAAPTDDVVRLSGAQPDSLNAESGQPASKRGSCPLSGLVAVRQLVRVVCLLIDEAEPIHVQHQEPDEMVVQMTSIEDLRWAVIAAEQELITIPPAPPSKALQPNSNGH